MANTLKFGNGIWATQEGLTLAYNDENDNYKPLPFDFTRASNATVVNKAGLIETVGNGIPRIDFSDSEDGALLLEPQRSNLINYSEDFTEWNLSNSGNGQIPILTSNYTTILGLNASRIIFNRTSASTSNVSSIRGNDYTQSTNTFSIYIKSNTSNVNIDFRLGSSIVAYEVTNEWKRMQFSGSDFYRSYFGLLGSSSDLYADLSIVAVQAEQGSYATSYIPTQGSSVTRVAETCDNGANEQVINSTEGVLYVETKGFIDVPSSSGYIQLSKSGELSGTNSFVIQHRNNGQLRVYVNGLGTADIHFIVDIDFTQNHKIAVLYKLNGYKLFIDGVAQSLYGTPTQTVFSGLNDLSFDLRGIFLWNGSIKDVKLYNTALTDEELEYITSYRSLNEMATALNLNEL